MHKPVRSRKSKDKLENGKIVEVVDLNDSLGNLLLSAEKLRNSLYQQKFKSPTSSLTVCVKNCINLVLSEYGEESIKRQRFKNDLHENKPKELNNNKWTNCVKVLEELVTSDKVLDQELINSILVLIAQVHERQSLRIANNVILHEIINKWISYMNRVDTTITQQYTRCLASFILGNLTDIPKEMFASLSGTFFRTSQHYLEISDPDAEALETLKYCVSGLTNLCYLAPSSDGSEIDDFLAKRFLTCGRFFNLFVMCLERLPLLSGLTQMSMFRMQHQCLHGLNYVSQRPHGLSLDTTERLLIVLRIYCGFGMFRIGGEISAVVTTDMDDHTYNNFPNDVIKEECNNYSHNLKENREYESQSCNKFIDRYESGEYEDFDEDVKTYRPMRKWEMKTRRLALELLLKVLAKSWKKVANDIWINFMPATAWGSRRRFNLLNVLDREQDSAMKLLVLKAIQQCVINCKDLLFSAQHQAAPSNFVSRSHSLACVIDEIHERLLATLVTDKSVLIRVETLRCLLALIRGVLYHRLRPTIVHSVVRGLRQVFLESSPNQTTLRCVVLDCFTSLVGFESVSAEMRHLLLKPTTQSVYLGDGDSQKCSQQPSWLVQLCVRLAHPTLVKQLWTSPLSSESWGADMDPVVAKVVAEGASDTDASVRCQALMTVGAMLSQHGSLVRPSLDTLKRTLLACLHESLLPHSANAPLRSHVLRVFSGFLGTLENKKAKRYLGIVQDSPQATVAEVSGHDIGGLLGEDSNEELSLDWWSSFLDSVVLCLRDSDDSVRTSAAQCMSLMSESVLLTLVGPDARQDYYQILLAMFQDLSVAVCCQAVWALGYWVAMRPLNLDLAFIRQLMHSCQQLARAAIDDSSVYVVCANATWSLSNAIEVLVAHKESLLTCCKPGPHLKPCRNLVSHYLADSGAIHELLVLFCDLCSLRKAGQAAASARIHENAIRGLGYLCRFVDDNLASQEGIAGQLLVASDTFCKAIQLPDKAGRVKVKWNACLSASHVCRNRALIRDTAVFSLESLVDTLVGTVASDRYFKVRNNSLMSLLTLVDHGGRPGLGTSVCGRVLGPVAAACVSVAHKSAVPFSEVHRHCLCLYLLKSLLLRTVAVLTDQDLAALALEAEVLATVTEVARDHLPTLWHQVHHLNKSFNKQTLLTETLMLTMPVEATVAEVDLTLASVQQVLDSGRWSLGPVCSLIRDTITWTVAARPRDNDDQVPGQGDPWPLAVNHPVSDQSDCDDGLMTKRHGTSLIFSQIYD